MRNLVQRALNLLETSILWNRKVSFQAHKVGLYGEEERLKYLAHKEIDLSALLQSSYWEATEPQLGTINPTDFSDCRTTMTGIIDKMWAVYKEMHSIANEMVAASYKPIADLLYCYLTELYAIIIELQKARLEYEWAKWEYHHISRYQISLLGNNVYDRYK